VCVHVSVRLVAASGERGDVVDEETRTANPSAELPLCIGVGCDELHSLRSGDLNQLRLHSLNEVWQ